MRKVSVLGAKKYTVERSRVQKKVDEHREA
jgi:hypothetical protein